MNVNFNNVPAELKGLKQWIMWKYEVKEGKKTKVPYQTSNVKASVTNPNHWGMLSDVEEAMDSGLFEGAGFVFTEEDEFTGVDVDKSVANREFDEKTKFIYAILSSYTEYSPSETGVHIIVKGEVPAGYKNKNTKENIECYNSGRFFTFTGDRIGDHELAERTKELNTFASRYLPKREVIEYSKPSTPTPTNINNMSNADLWNKMFNSKNGDRIKSLCEGNIENDDRSSTDLTLCNFLAFWTNNDPQRMNDMFCETQLYREKWDRKTGNSTYGEITIQTAINGTKNTIADAPSRKVETVKELDVAEEVSDEIRKEETGTPSFDLTELGNGKRIAHYDKDKMLYCAGLNWMVWTGKKWQEDNKYRREIIAANTLEKIINDKPKNEDHEKEIVKWVKKCGSRNIRKNSIDDARPHMAIDGDRFDRQGMMFNCSNGTVNLETGELLKHDREMLLTQMSNFEFDTEAKCPTWLKFVNDTLVDKDGNTDQELVNFMQKAVGYTLTGDISEQVVFFLYGGGRNGKSIFANTIQNMMNEYGRQVNSSTFIKKKNDSGINNDIARLHGSRYVSAIESEAGDSLSEALIKQITGGEKVTARFLHKEHFEFMPEFKVFFATNHKPEISGMDNGIWRRVKLIPFLRQLKESEVDGHLQEKLNAEISGIFNWALEGCMKWQSEGLGEAKSITEATESYKDEMDVIAPFVDEYCIAGTEFRHLAKELFEGYSKWCFENNEPTLNKKEFFKLLENKGFKKEKGTANKLYFNGIKLQERALTYI